MTAVKTIWGPASINMPASGFLSGHNLSDADNSVACRMCLPKDGTITDIGLHVISTAGSFPTDYNIGLVTLDSGTGLPTTSAYGGSSVDSFDPTSTGWRWHTLGTPATANAGDLAAVRIWPGATTPTGSNYCTIAYEPYIKVDLPSMMFYAVSWSSRNGLGLMAVLYDDGSVYGLTGTFPGASAFNSTSTPDEVAAKFTIPADMTCNGVVINMLSTSSNASFDIILYNSGGTALRTISIGDEDLIVLGTSYQSYHLYFDSLSLVTTETYRLAIKATTNINLLPVVYEFDSAGDLTGNLFIPEGANWSYSYRSDLGSWSDDASKLPGFGLIISDITFSAGTSGAYGWA